MATHFSLIVPRQVSGGCSEGLLVEFRARLVPCLVVRCGTRVSHLFNIHWHVFFTGLHHTRKICRNAVLSSIACIQPDKNEDGVKRIETMDFDFASAWQRLVDRTKAAGWEPLVAGCVFYKYSHLTFSIHPSTRYAWPDTCSSAPQQNPYVAHSPLPSHRTSSFTIIYHPFL